VLLFFLCVVAEVFVLTNCGFGVAKTVSFRSLKPASLASGDCSGIIN
jgi:hypothetical protein